MRSLLIIFCMIIGMWFCELAAPASVATQTSGLFLISVAAFVAGYAMREHDEQAQRAGGAAAECGSPATVINNSPQGGAGSTPRLTSH